MIYRRLMFRRRYSDGLHQAIEAKEGVKIETESQTLARITFQNFFRMYKKLAGMTGTAATEEEEFRNIYGLDVVVIPTHEPMIRVDYPDMVYKTEAGKFNAVLAEILDCNRRGQPVLVGTVSIEKSEQLSALLKRQGIPHQVLNAKYHEQEAEIVAQAGRLGSVTIATNMAGRGTDILLGGNSQFLAKEELERQGYDLDLVERELYEAVVAEMKKQCKREHEQVVAAGDCISSAPSAMRPGASTINCAAAADARGTRGRHAFIYRWRTICCGYSGGRISPG